MGNKGGMGFRWGGWLRWLRWLLWFGVGVLGLVFVVLVGGCGQSGALYLPEEGVEREVDDGDD